MKVVAYSIKVFEKEFLAKANQKKHEITLISNPLSLETAAFAEGKDAAIVFTNDDVSAPVINKLATLGVKYIVTRSAGTDHIDKKAAAKKGIQVANVPVFSPQAVAEHALALALSLNRHLVDANNNAQQFDFRLDELIGFNLSSKTIGVIGLGNIGKAVSKIYNGFCSKVIGYDIDPNINLPGVTRVDFETLLKQADLISIHVPLTPDTKYLINQKTIGLMKNGVMLINTSRGAVIKTMDALRGLESGKIGYFGLDVYEYEKGLFFEDHKDAMIKDPLLEKLMHHPNVLVTPHQGFLTKEALVAISNETIKHLDLWQAEKQANEYLNVKQADNGMPVPTPQQRR